MSTTITITHDLTNRAYIAQGSQVWDTTGTPAMTAYDGANLANYLLVPTQVDDSLRWVYTIPALPAGDYELVVLDGASPASTDYPIEVRPFAWSGTAIITIATAQTALAAAQTDLDTITDTGVTLTAAQEAAIQQILKSAAGSGS